MGIVLLSVAMSCISCVRDTCRGGAGERGGVRKGLQRNGPDLDKAPADHRRGGGG